MGGILGLWLTKEQVIRIWRITTDSKYFNQIEELPMDVPNYCDGGEDVHDIALLHQKFLRLGAYCFNDRVGEQFFLV